VYVRPYAGWTDVNVGNELTNFGGVATDLLGWSVAISADGSTRVAGVPYANGGGTDRGEVAVLAHQVAFAVLPGAASAGATIFIAVWNFSPNATNGVFFPGGVGDGTFSNLLFGSFSLLVPVGASSGPLSIRLPGRLDISLPGFIYLKTPQSISFLQPPDMLVNATQPISPTASSGQPVSLASLTGSVCSVATGAVTASNVGTCTIRASQPGNADYEAAGAVDRSFAVLKRPQTIAFDHPASIAFGATQALAATATSGLAVSFASLTPAVCAVSGTAVTAMAAGTCIIRASQLGNGVHEAATSVDREFPVAKGSQSIVIPELTSLAVGASQTIAASASSGLAVVVSSLTPAVCTVSGSTVTALGPGTCIVEARQDGGANYLPAAPQQRSFDVGLFRSALPFLLVGSPAS
jgi:hypothetical protein